MTLFKIKHPGRETARAKRAGRTVHKQAEIDSHSSNKRIRGMGIFALNSEAGLFRRKKHKGKKGKRKML